MERAFPRTRQGPSCPLPWSCEQPASARWGGAQASRRPAQGADRQPHGTRCLEGHHASGPQRVHLLGRGCQAGDDPRTPHSPDPGGAGGRPASALLLARLQAPRAHRQIAVGAVLSSREHAAGDCGTDVPLSTAPRCAPGVPEPSGIARPRVPDGRERTPWPLTREACPAACRAVTDRQNRYVPFGVTAQVPPALQALISARAPFVDRDVRGSSVAVVRSLGECHRRRPYLVSVGDRDESGVAMKDFVGLGRRTRSPVPRSRSTDTLTYAAGRSLDEHGEPGGRARSRHEGVNRWHGRARGHEALSMPIFAPSAVGRRQSRASPTVRSAPVEDRKSTNKDGSVDHASLSTQRVAVSIDGGVADVRLNRADKLNTLDVPMFRPRWSTRVEQLKHNNVQLRAVVLSGEGRGFCAGLDVGSLQAMSGSDVDSQPSNSVLHQIGNTDGRITHLGQQAAYVWQELQCPVIAAVHGVALGGGCPIALCADMRLASPDARFSVLEIRWGIVPDMTGTAMLPLLVGLDVAKELSFTGRMVSADEAARIGLVTRVSDSPLDDALRSLRRSPAGARRPSRLKSPEPGEGRAARRAVPRRAGDDQAAPREQEPDRGRDGTAREARSRLRGLGADRSWCMRASRHYGLVWAR